MNLKTNLLLLLMAFCIVGVQGQSFRNPLNNEPGSLKLTKGISSKILTNKTFYQSDSMQFDRYEYEYYDDGELKSELFRTWDKENNAWQDFTRESYVYEEQKVVMISEIWKATEWENVSKTEQTLDESGQKQYSLSYSWDPLSDSWGNLSKSKDEWTYNENGLKKERQTILWNEETGAYDGLYIRILYTYDEKDRLSEEMIQAWDRKDSKWYETGKYVHSYDEENNQVISKSYVYSGGNWMTDGRIECAYDDEGDLNLCEYYGINANRPLDAYCVYEYSDKTGTLHIAESEEINVYPNPAISFFELSVSETLVGKEAYLFDVSGKQVKTIVLNEQKIRIDTSGLPVGIYFVKAGPETKKIILK